MRERKEWKARDWKTPLCKNILTNMMDIMGSVLMGEWKMSTLYKIRNIHEISKIETKTQIGAYHRLILVLRENEKKSERLYWGENTHWLLFHRICPCILRNSSLWIREIFEPYRTRSIAHRCNEFRWLAQLMLLWIQLSELPSVQLIHSFSRWSNGLQNFINHQRIYSRKTGFWSVPQNFRKYMKQTYLIVTIENQIRNYQ